MILPCFMKIAMSNRANTSDDGWWIVHNTAAFCWAIFFSSCTQFAAENESSPDVGSSRKSSEGLVITSTPTLVRFRWPPLMPFINAPPIIVSAHSRRPRSESVVSTRAVISARVVVGGSRNNAENSNAFNKGEFEKNQRFASWKVDWRRKSSCNITSLGVAVAIKASSCITYAILFLNSTGLIFFPATETSPVILMPGAGAERPASTFSKDDFPDEIKRRV